MSGGIVACGRCGSTHRHAVADGAMLRGAEAVRLVGDASVTKREDQRAIVLVVDDVEETRDGIEKLLTADGYRVDPARNEDDAVEKARRQCPDLILVSLGGPPLDIIASAARVRDRAALSDLVPVVVFCIPTLEEGAEVALGRNVYVTRPDNFDQLRAFLGRLLGESLWWA